MLQMKLPEIERHLAMKGGDHPLAEVDCPFKVYFVTTQEHTQTSRTVYTIQCTYHAQIQAECFMKLKQKRKMQTQSNT